MTAYYSDGQTTLYHGKALDVLRTLPDESVNCIVTSPPYFGLRSYLADDHPDKAAEIGTEKSPAEFVGSLVAVFAEARRVLAKDGTLWLNLGDSYANAGGAGRQGSSGQRADRTFTAEGLRRRGDRPAKNLLGIPWRVAFALQDDGWILRNDVIWAKPNGMPESVTDRLATKHEHLFLFARSPRYWFDLEPIREPLAFPEAADGTRVFGGKAKADDPAYLDASGRRRGAVYGKAASSNGGRNPGDWWVIPTQPFAEAHFAVFPIEIPRRCIAAGCKPGGVVLDPFSGSGTTGKAAAELGRRYVGIDLNRDYLDLSLRTRLAQPSLTAEATG